MKTPTVIKNYSKEKFKQICKINLSKRRVKRQNKKKYMVHSCSED